MARDHALGRARGNGHDDAIAASTSRSAAPNSTRPSCRQAKSGMSSAAARTASLSLADPLAHAGEEEPHGGHLTAPMSGSIVAVLVKPGDKVERGAPLVILEAMKMEHTIAAPAAGVVAAVHYRAGDRVREGADLIDLDDA